MGAEEKDTEGEGAEPKERDIPAGGVGAGAAEEKPNTAIERSGAELEGGGGGGDW